MLNAEDISVTYRTRGGVIEALKDVRLRIGRGEFVTLLGPSGCGKSTLLKIAAGLLRPSAGHIAIAGKPSLGPNRAIGVAFQKPTLMPWKTVLENILLPAHTLKLDLTRARARARELLSLVGLAEFSHNYPNELSGGMQQRVGLARMLLGDPKLLLMDEPFAALDAMTRENLTLELQRIWLQDRKSVLFITHSIPEAVFLSDRVLVMSARPGKIIEDYAVTLPRPRSPETLSSPLFSDACRHLRRHFLEQSQ
ncbi:ATP-binding cassette domain-containing protein [Enterobacteriales bacterium SAP-6]|uniref:ATP-binding cassette domain-containing protein n=2 Tax=Acerihabitans arboris TaxID=2691583 RepID=A0A845SX72_9GAMM|nr:ATP-binding cassette domain-containing protein [Acerihabitans arboris]